MFHHQYICEIICRPVFLEQKSASAQRPRRPRFGHGPGHTAFIGHQTEAQVEVPGGIPNIGQHRHKCYRSWNLGALTPAAWVRIAICLIGLFFFLDAVVVLAMSCDEFSDIDLPFDTTNKGTQQNSSYKSKVKMAEKIQ